MKRVQSKDQKGATRIIEESVHLLRLVPSALLPSYYVGSLPFVLGFLYFWGDMSRSAAAREYCAVGSFGLALLFVWMKCWQAVFAVRVKTQMKGTPDSPWTRRRILSLVATQTLIQSTSLLILPLAALLIIPFGWCCAFYQNVTAQTDQEYRDIKTICANAWQQANLWPRQNHILLLVFSLFGILVFLNVAIAILIFPHLLKKFLGIESMFTLSGPHLINTTFWTVALGMTYLCIDPLVKTAYAMRCFYGTALRSGEDLKTELTRFLRGGKKVVVAMLIFVLSMAPMSAVAVRTFSTSAEELDRSIEEVMSRREFTWRMPREAIQSEEEEAEDPLSSLTGWIMEKVRECLKALKGWIGKLGEWLAKLWPEGDDSTKSSKSDWMASARVVIISLLVLLLCALGYVLWRTWRKHRGSQVDITATAVESTPELTDDGITAEELPANSWLDLARELAEKGSLRLAMRALYLATLAYLAEHEIITIEMYKSNREYELELRRRAHEKKELHSVFSKSLNLFERVWYGMYKITRPELNNFATMQERIMAFAEK